MPRITIRLLFLLSVTGILGAQEGLYTLKVEVPVVSVNVTVTDTSGATVDNLLKSDFAILENGVPQEIANFSPASAPYNVLLLFDKSGSIQHKWPFMQRAILAFIASLRPHDRLAIGTFGYELEMHVEWNDSRRKAVDSIPNLLTAEPTGGTDLYGSLDRALSREFRGVAGRGAVLVLTDGRDTSLYRQVVARNRIDSTENDREFQKVFRTARRQRIPIYFAAINTDQNLDPNTAGADEYRNLRTLFPNSPAPSQYLAEVRNRMEQLSDVSGGGVLFPRSIDDIIPMYERIAREMGISYSLGYISSNPVADGSFRKIEVQPRRSGLRMAQSRPGYTAR